MVKRVPGRLTNEKNASFFAISDEPRIPPTPLPPCLGLRQGLSRLSEHRLPVSLAGYGRLVLDWHGHNDWSHTGKIRARCGNSVRVKKAYFMTFRELEPAAQRNI